MIETYVNDIKKALANGLYFPALSLALTLPDICGSVGFPNKEVHERYIKWYDRYVCGKEKDISEKSSSIIPYLSGEVVYNLRNTFLHNGNPDIDVKKIKDEDNQISKFFLVTGNNPVFDKIAFTLTDIQHKVIIVDVSFLCGSICDAAFRYYRENKSKFNFEHKVITADELYKGGDILDNIVKRTMGDNYSIIGPSDIIVNKFPILNEGESQSDS